MTCCVGYSSIKWSHTTIQMVLTSLILPFKWYSQVTYYHSNGTHKSHTTIQMILTYILHILFKKSFAVKLIRFKLSKLFLFGRKFYIHMPSNLKIIVRGQDWLILLLTKFSSTLASKLPPIFCQSGLKCKSFNFLTETVSMLIATKRATSFKLDI